MLQLQTPAPNLIPAIGVLAALAIPLLAGVRGVKLVIFALALVVPSVAVVSSLLSFFIRPVLVVYRPRQPRQPRPPYRKPEVITTLFGDKKAK